MKRIAKAKAIAALLAATVGVASCSKGAVTRAESGKTTPIDVSALHSDRIGVGSRIAPGKLLDATQFGLTISAELSEVSPRTASAKVVIRNDDALDVMVYGRWGTPVVWVVAEGDDGQWTCIHVEGVDTQCGTGLGYVRIKSKLKLEANFGFPPPDGRVRIGICIDPRSAWYSDDGEELVRGPPNTDSQPQGLVWSQPLKSPHK